MKKTTKQILFEKMEYLNPGFKKMNEEENILINKFLAFLPDDFPNLVRGYSKDKNIGLDDAYYQFVGAFEKKFEEAHNMGVKLLSDDDLDDLNDLMYGRFGDDAIEF